MSTVNLIGPDVSFYQDAPSTPRQIDFVTMRQAGASFVIIRAGQNTWIDSDFAYNWQKAKEAGLPRGSYWFYDSRATPRSQADLWKQAIGTDYPECGLWADFEESYGGAYGAEKYFIEFIEHVKDAFPTSVEVGVYTANFYWMNRVKDYTYWHQYPLWIANYGVTVPLVPPPWKPDEWTFWQFTDRGDGLKYGVESSRIDLNYYNGGLAEFVQQFGNNASQPLPEPEIPLGGTMEKYEVITAGLNLRLSPPTSDGTLGAAAGKQMVRGDTFESDKKTAATPPWLRITSWIRASDGKEIIPPAGTEWWCSGSASYVKLIGTTTPPPTTEPPPPVVTDSVYEVKIIEDSTGNVKDVEVKKNGVVIG